MRGLLGEGDAAALAAEPEQAAAARRKARKA